MKVKVNLTNQTLEYIDNKPYIQGFDTRNRLIVYVPTSVVFGEGDNIQIAYQLQNGRNTIKLPNNGVVEATLAGGTTPNPDYIAGYNGFIFNAFTNVGEPLAVTNQAGNFTATLVFKVSGKTYKLNVLNTVLKSTDFEEFESAVEGVAQEVLHSLDSMSDIVTELQQTIDDISANDFSEDDAKEIFYTKTQSDSKYAKFKLITNIANIPVETLESLEIGDILVSGAYAYMVLKGLQAQNAAYNRYIYGIEDTATLKVYWYEKTSVSGTDWYLRILTYPLARYSSTDKLNADYIADGTTNKVFTGTEQTKLSGIEAGAEVNVIEGVKVNGTAQTPDANKIISLTIPTQASDVNALPNSTKYCASCVLSINSSTYVMSLQLKDQDGNNLGTAKTIDLPLETMVVSGSYDSTNKKVVLTLQNGQTIEFSVADLVSGLQTEITAQNKLSSDLVDDTGHTNKFVNADEKSVIDNIGYFEISSTIPSAGLEVTEAQLTEVAKKYCIIKYKGVNYYKYKVGTTTDFVNPQIKAAKNNLTGVSSLYNDIISVGSQLIFTSETAPTIPFYDSYTIDSLLANKVDKVTGKGLSTNDYTNEDKAVVDSLNAVATTTDTTANVVDVPTSAKGLATLKRIGGMSYKCKNLWNGNAFTAYGSYNLLENATLQPSTTYTISSNATVGEWAIILNGVANEGTVATNSITFTTPSTITSIALYFNTSNSNVVLMLNLGSTALPYEAYYEGIHDSAVTKVESVGANIWDEVWEVGALNSTTGANYPSDNTIRSKNYIRVKPSTNYYRYCASNKTFVVLGYDNNKNYIGVLVNYGSNGVIEVPSNVYYIRFFMDSYGSTYNHDICINVSNSAINGNYYPYTKYELAIPSGIRSLTGYGWGVNDTCYNYIDFTLNEFRQYVGRVDLGSLTWSYNVSGAQNEFAAIISNGKIDASHVSNPNAVCAIYTTASQNDGFIQMGNMYLAFADRSYSGSACYVTIKNSAYTDATAFKTAMSGVYLYYELATPVITDISSLLDEVHIPIEANGTLELVNTYNNAVPVIVSFDNGLIDVVLTNHEHDIEQQKDIDELEEFKASNESILDKMAYDSFNGKLIIKTGNNSQYAQITLSDSGAIELKTKLDGETARTITFDYLGLKLDGDDIGKMYMHDIVITFNDAKTLHFKIQNRTDAQMNVSNLADFNFATATDKLYEEHSIYETVFEITYDSSTLTLNISYMTNGQPDNVEYTTSNMATISDTVISL